MNRMLDVCSFALAFTLSAAASNPACAAQSRYQALIDAAVDSTARPAADRDLDAARKPKQMLAFFGIAPGMKVLDMFAGGGWYTELEARVVGASGEVYAQNPPQYLQKFGDQKITARLADNRLPNVKRWDKSLDAMDLSNAYFDGVIANDVFHDFFWLSADVDGILGQVYAALKPNGFFAIVDHSAPAGTGDSFARDAKGQHRIDEEFVKAKLIKAGFKLVAHSDLLRNPEDDRTKPFFDPAMKGKNTDKFALLFRKPR